ncbi:hypothetical protein TIFTF001_017326 [Ficus carica]|uniref:Uncharacterized protein n=1 Tax=Ficus carica TaxID=3494 RepID=A0AA88AU93_FICCA|nr:hypothetical protein TIFTF001_017326 [Ficus carica]
MNSIGRPCTIVLRLIACKREAPRSKGDTGLVFAKGTLMLKSAFPSGLGARVILVGRIPSGPSGLTCSRCTDIGPPLDECHLPFLSGDEGTRLVWDCVTGAVRANHPDWGSVVVWEMLPGPVLWVPTVICSRS